jgi:hypothetical protein
MEHRQARREPTEILVLVSTADGVTRKACIKDISTLGAAVVMNSGALVRGSLVEIRLSPTGSRQRSHGLRLRGYVVRAQDGESGLLWVTENAIAPILTNLRQGQRNIGPDDTLLIA